MKTQNFFRAVYVVVFLMLCSNNFSAQTWVKPEQMTTDNIAKYLTSKNFEVTEKTKDFLKINKKGETRYMYLDFKDSNRYIFFNIAYKVIDNVDQAKLTSFLQKVNKFDVVKVNHFEKGNDVQIEYYFWTKNGFSYESLQDAIEEFFLYEGDCINADEEKILE